MISRYIERIIDNEIKENLKSVGIVLIEGQRCCGKTSSSIRIANSVFYIENLIQTPNYQNDIELLSSAALEGDSPRLIDEWQLIPSLWNKVESEINRRNEFSLFILTSSSAPKEDPIGHSKTEIFARIKMRTMSLFESGESNGKVSLSDLFNKKIAIDCSSNLTVDNLILTLVRGGWPASIGKELKIGLENLENILETIIQEDISKIGEKRNPTKVRALLKSYARNIATQATNKKLLNDIEELEESISLDTIHSYLSSLERLHIIEELPAWTPTLKSKIAIRTSPKRYFSDPSIAAYLLSASTDSLRKDWKTLGSLFESLCIRDLRIYSQSIGGTVYHFKDENDFEIDSIVLLKDGRWGAIDIRMGESETEKSAKKLLKFENKLKKDPNFIGPSFLMILTATQYAYQRADGVLIVPIGCLRD